MEKFLNGLIRGRDDKHKEQKQQTSLLQKILDTQRSILGIEKSRLKAAQRDEQKKKRSAADAIRKSLLPSKGKDQGKEEAKKKGGFLSNLLNGLLAGMTGLSFVNMFLDRLLGKGQPGQSLMNRIMERLFPTRRDNQGLMSRIMERLFGRGKNGSPKGFVTKFFDDIGNGIKSGFDRLFGPDSKIGKSINNLFGEKSAIGKALKNLSTTIDDVVTKMSGPFSNLFKGFRDGGIKKGLKQIPKLGQALIGKTPLGQLIRGGALAGLTSGVMEYQESESVTRATAQGGGAFGGVVAGGKLGGTLGMVLGPKGAAVGGLLGGILGGIVGEKAAEAIYDSIMENPTIKGTFKFIDSFFRGYFDELKATFDSFMDAASVVSRAINRFVTETWDSLTNEIEYFSGEINKFVTDTWNTLTKAFDDTVLFFQEKFNPLFEGIAQFWEDNVDPIIKDIQKFLKPVTDELEKLANKVITPLSEGFELLKTELGKFTSWIGGFFGGGEQTEGAGRGFASMITGGAKGFFTSIADAFRDYADGKQLGGFVGKVPGMGGNGDRFPAMLTPGSVVVNQVAAGMMQSGGLVPTMLEQGEIVVPPGSQAGSALAMNSMFPRFQTGGVVGEVPITGDPIPQTQASGARTAPTQTKPTKKDAEKEAEAAEATEGKVGADAIIAAAEKSAGIYAGVSEMCARTTRDVLKLAGHPAATKTTSSADLDSPKGYGPSKANPDLAGSFAGTDMGTVYEDPKSAPPGSVIMWRGTYGVDKWGPEAVTHVGIRGKGSDMYHHGSGPGWRKQNMSAYPPDFAVDLNGEATGVSGSGGGQMSGLAGIMQNAAQGAASGIMAFLGGSAAADFMSGFGEVFKGVGDIFGAGLDLGGAAIKDFFTIGGGNATPNTGGGGSQTFVGGGDGTYGSDVLLKYAKANGITDKTELAMFMAQMGHESGSYKYRTEIASGEAYNPGTRVGKVLGNTQPGDGPRFKGRGYVQLTGRWNYGHYGKMIGEDLVNNPDLAADPEIALKIAIAYWKDRVNRDAARKGNIRQVTKDINGGYNGLADREARFAKWQNKNLQEGGIVMMQTGGIAQVRPGSGAASRAMAKQSQENFLERMIQGQSPIVVPIPMMGGGGQDQTQVVPQPGTQTQHPILPSQDNSVVSMEYKYRITMGASV